MLDAVEREAKPMVRTEDLMGDNVSERLAFSAGQQSVVELLRLAIRNNRSKPGGG